ncbi:DUF3313 domain-containing protein [Caballeronia sp. LZ001]|uniref:DUF3313 domain-containing protein n=1 Tax=Caballeronia sp. LZ001 TaxID=3038553 RepID=UPI00285FE6D7|nr:DUF3313 domain-containing protein [Caballeronia sp. LZ001]MDR5806527.1 DUF3313 domain-containing protein [Caballeronia sp. LZ001]
MFRRNVVPLLVAAVAVLTLSACAGVQPVPYTGISSSSKLQQNLDDDSGKVPYKYASPVVWSRYTQVLLDPVVVYQGSDNQFGDVKNADRDELAGYMEKTFSKELATRFQLAKQPGPDTLRVKLTLTGAERTKPLVGQFMHFDLAGNLYNGVQAVRGGQGAFSGSVSYAVEVYDSSNGRLLKAYVSKQYPNAMNLPAAFGSLGAAKTGLDKGAAALVAQLH